MIGATFHFSAAELLEMDDDDLHFWNDGTQYINETD